MEGKGAKARYSAEVMRLQLWREQKPIAEDSSAVQAQS